MSSLCFILYILFELLTPRTHSYVSRISNHPWYVNFFVISILLLGFFSSINEGNNVPTDRGIGTFFHVIFLWGAAMLIADLVWIIFHFFGSIIRRLYAGK